MKKTIATLALALSTVSAAATDTSSIPSRTAPTAPVSEFGSLVQPKMWVGVNGGFSLTDGINRDAPWSIGVNGGYNVVRLGPLGLGVEGTYDYKKGDTQTVIGNAITSFSFGSFTPYALAGVGYRWDASRSREVNEKVWNVGGGVKYAISRNIEVDTRYRRIEDFDRARPDDRVTLGVNFKF
jgi:opacity protein-like surface antigen